MIANIANLMRWEWFKLRRRWMLWVLLAFSILFGQLALWGQYFSYQNLRSTGGELTIPASLQPGGRVPRTVACNDLLSGDPARRPADLNDQVVAGLAAQCAQLAPALPARVARGYNSFALPGAFRSALSIVQGLALILMAVLTASAIGIDYGSGTLRSVLAQGTGRWTYLVAKIITLAAVLAAGLLITLATVAVGSAIATGIAGDPPASAGVVAPTLGDAGMSLWKAWLSVLPYVSLVAFVTIFARSSAAGMAIGLGYYFAEQLIIALFSALFSWFNNVADYLLVRNITAWTGGGTGGIPGGPLPDETHAAILLTIYSLAFLAVAFWLFERRDVTGATGAG